MLRKAHSQEWLCYKGHPLSKKEICMGLKTQLREARKREVEAKVAVLAPSMVTV